MITPIAPERVPRIWEQAEAALRGPLAVLHERTTHHVLIELLTGAGQLWHLHGDGADAWTVTTIEHYPCKKVARATLCAGKLSGASIREMREAFSAWAIARGATELRIRGRKGWGRYMPDAGVTLLFRLDLAAAPADRTPPE